MSDIMAAIGRVQLGRLEELSKKRKNLANKYDDLLLDCKEVFSFEFNYKDINPHIYPILLGENISRDFVKNELRAQGIETGIHYFPNHLLDFFKTKKRVKLKNTERIYSKILTLPLHPDLSERQINFVCSTLLKIIK